MADIAEHARRKHGVKEMTGTLADFLKKGGHAGLIVPLWGLVSNRYSSRHSGAPRSNARAHSREQK